MGGLKYVVTKDCYVDDEGREYPPSSLSEETKRRAATIAAAEMVTPNIRRVSTLSRQRDVLIEYLTSKAAAYDWHAVADAACDLRELEARMAELERK